jgi:hypothetical protein
MLSALSALWELGVWLEEEGEEDGQDGADERRRPVDPKPSTPVVPNVHTGDVVKQDVKPQASLPESTPAVQAESPQQLTESVQKPEPTVRGPSSKDERYQYHNHKRGWMKAKK